jgi:hypothetical protein
MNAVPPQTAFTTVTDPSAQAEQYLARVVAWPNAGGSPAIVNICNTFQGQGYDKPRWTGRAARSLDEAISYIGFCLNQPDTRDIYVCLSTQREPGAAKTASNGYTYYKANRGQQNAVALKSLFIDLDAKGTDKNSYDNPKDAMAALAAFIKETGLPKPNVVVNSGGGFHIYWVMSRALSVDEWKPLAFALAEATKQHGLKCDTQCTIDCARVLRIPNTLNRKTEPPRPVQLISFREGDYSVESLEQSLAQYKVAVPASATESFLEDPAHRHGPAALPLRVRARARESAKKAVTNQRNVHTPTCIPSRVRSRAVAFYCNLEIMEMSTPCDLAIAANVSPAARRLTASARW